MRLTNLDDCDRKIFYKQMGGKDSLITVENAFDMLMALPVITELQIYNKAIDDAINKIVSTKSEVAEKEPFNEHLFTVLAQRQNEIIDLIQKLKAGGQNEP